MNEKPVSPKFGASDPERLERIRRLVGLDEKAFAVLWTQSPAFHTAAHLIGELLLVVDAAEDATRRFKANDPGTATSMAVLRSQVSRWWGVPK